MKIQSENLLEIAAEIMDPAHWAAMQILKGGRPDMTQGEAMKMIEQIVRQSWEMEERRRKEFSERTLNILNR